jgi:hypothetical protein
MIFYRNLRYLPVALKSENLPMGWKEAIYTYPSSIVYEIHVQTQFKRTIPRPKFVGGLKSRLKTRALVWKNATEPGK